MPERRFAAAAEAADHIRVTQKTIREWIHDGKLPGYRFGPGTIRVDLNELEALGGAI
jgi:excisionase family DNA binding protein